MPADDICGATMTHPSGTPVYVCTEPAGPGRLHGEGWHYAGAHPPRALWPDPGHPLYVVLGGVCQAWTVGSTAGGDVTVWCGRPVGHGPDHQGRDANGAPKLWTTA